MLKQKLEKAQIVVKKQVARRQLELGIVTKVNPQCYDTFHRAKSI